MSYISTIRKALHRIMSPGEANACNIFKGYAMSTGESGYHYVPFNSTAVYLGKNLSQALETIDQIADEREEVKASAAKAGYP